MGRKKSARIHEGAFVCPIWAFPFLLLYQFHVIDGHDFHFHYLNAAHEAVSAINEADHRLVQRIWLPLSKLRQKLPAFLVASKHPTVLIPSTSTDSFAETNQGYGDGVGYNPACYAPSAEANSAGHLRSRIVTPRVHHIARKRFISQPVKVDGGHKEQRSWLPLIKLRQKLPASLSMVPRRYVKQQKLVPHRRSRHLNR